VDIDDAPWVAHRVVRLNEDIKADVKYQNTGELKPNMSIEDFVYSYLYPGVERVKFTETRRSHHNVGRERPQAIYNELWEIHNKRDMSVKVVCKDHLSFLRDEPDAVMLACGMPFVSGTFVEHPRSFWGTPLAYYLGQHNPVSYRQSLGLYSPIQSSPPRCSLNDRNISESARGIRCRNEKNERRSHACCSGLGSTPNSESSDGKRSLHRCYCKSK
jgi:hypothetical protein